MACTLGQVLDHLDRALAELWSQAQDVTVLVGSRSPFGHPFASVFGRTGDGYLFGLLGPLRMDYERSLGVVRYVVGNV
jgi:transcriptional regulator of heat shock response